MEDFQVRQAISSDIVSLTTIDPSYSTEYVWQMGFRSGAEEFEITFREVRLPRPMRVTYPRNPSLLVDQWTSFSALFIAQSDSEALGYLCMVSGPAPGSQWITDLVVSLARRRQGIGSRLVQAARGWSLERGCQRLYLEMQSKNHPASALARRLGFSFAGYSDRYYPDQDIALFYALELSKA